MWEIGGRVELTLWLQGYTAMVIFVWGLAFMQPGRNVLRKAGPCA